MLIPLRGGIKLFKKIIDKYNLGNEYKDLKTNIENCSSGDGGSSSKYAPRYFSIDWDKADEDWKNLLSSEVLIFKIASLIKLDFGYGIIIETYGLDLVDYNKILAFSFCPLYMGEFYINQLGIGEHSGHIDTIKDAIFIINKMKEISGEQPLNISMNGITEITEEEFYKID